MAEQVPQLEEFEEPKEIEEPAAFAQPAVLTEKGLDKAQMEQAAGEVLTLKSQGYEDDEIRDYIAQKYGLDRQTAEVTFETLMRYLQKKAEDRKEIQKQALGMLPTLAQSDNPFAGLVMQSLIEKAGLNEEESFTRELIELQKELMKTKMAMEMMKEINGSSGSSSNDQLIATLITNMMQEKKEIEQNFYQLLMAQMQGARNEEVQQLADVVRQSIDALNQKIEAVMMAQANSQAPADYAGPKDPVEEMAEFSEKLKRMQEAMKALGFEVKAPGNDDPAKLVEAQMKLKELELKQKEVEAKQVFYSKIAEALSRPETLQTIFAGLRDLFGAVFNRGPAPQAYANAMQQAAQVAPTPVEVEPVKPPATVPSLDDFLSETETAEKAMGVPANAGQD